MRKPREKAQKRSNVTIAWRGIEKFAKYGLGAMEPSDFAKYGVTNVRRNKSIVATRLNVADRVGDRLPKSKSHKNTVTSFWGLTWVYTHLSNLRL